MPKPQLLIVGNGMAAARLLDELVARDHGYAITVLGAEPGGAYNRVQLSSVLAGEMSLEATVTHPPAWYAQHGIHLCSGVTVQQLDLAAQTLHCADGSSLRYDHLVLATGSRSFMPPTPGNQLQGVLGFRTHEDVQAMLAQARPGAAAVVIGGGILGLEAAYGLLQRGMQVRVVHRAPILMERQLDDVGAAILQTRLEKLGIQFSMACEAQQYLGETEVAAVRLSNGETHPAHLVVVAAGIIPNKQLAESAGLRCGRGVVVDNQMASSDPQVSAVGECAEHGGQCYGLVAPLYEQATALAQRLCGQAAEYRGSNPSTRLKVTGLEVFSAGQFMHAEGLEVLEYREKRRGIYRKLVLREGVLVGTLLVGDARDANGYADLMREGKPVAAQRQTLLFGPSSMEQAA